MKPLVIYHAGCMDGAGAALAAWLKFGEDAEYRPAQYGDPAPTDDEVRGRDVYVLDFSYPRAELERISKACDSEPQLEVPLGRLRVLDHHKTAQKDLDGLPFCKFDMERSGAVLAYYEFHVDLILRMPARLHPLFRYIQDRDLWQWELPRAREISAALASYDCTSDFRRLAEFVNLDAPDTASVPGSRLAARLVPEGMAILRAQQQMVERIAAGAESVTVGGWGALAVSSPVLQSELGETLAMENARRGGAPIGACYFRDGKSGKWIVSLRSRDGYDGLGSQEGRQSAPDVSAIAKQHGGGGHARAAGFQCDRLPWV